MAVVFKPETVWFCFYNVCRYGQQRLTLGLEKHILAFSRVIKLKIAKKCNSLSTNRSIHLTKLLSTKLYIKSRIVIVCSFCNNLSVVKRSVQAFHDLNL